MGVDLDENLGMYGVYLHVTLDTDPKGTWPSG